MRVVFGLAAVLQVGLCSADAVCSDPQTCSQRTSLMQMKSVNLKQSNDGSMHATLMYFQSFTQNLVNQFEQRRARKEGQPTNVALGDATVVSENNSESSPKYDQETLESIREIMGTIKETLAGALHDNMHRAVQRIADCQLLGDYTGAKLAGSPAYHVGYFEHQADKVTSVYDGNDRNRVRNVYMRKTHATGGGFKAGLTKAESHNYTLDESRWDQKKVRTNVKSVHEQCWEQSELLEGAKQIEALWETSETKRYEHKYARETRQDKCVEGDVNECEEYDNLRWYSDDALLSSYPCKYASEQPDGEVSAERPDDRYKVSGSGDLGQTNTFARHRMGCTSGDCFAFNGRTGGDGARLVNIPRETAFAPAYLRATTDVVVAEMENCLFQTKVWLEQLYGKYRKCVEKHTNTATENGLDPKTNPGYSFLHSDKNDAGPCAEGRAECDRKQHDFEIARCWWAVDHDYHCKSYVDCVKSYFGTKSHCNTLCKDVREITARNKADYETGERIQCLLETLFGSINPTYSSSAYDAADKTTWPLLPRSVNNTALLNSDASYRNRVEDDDETSKWVKWCHGDRGSFSSEEVLARYYTPTDSYDEVKRAKASHLNWNAPLIVFENPSFGAILKYEKRYFDIRCTGDADLNGVADTGSRMFGLQLPSANKNNSQTTMSWDLSTSGTSAAYGVSPRTDSHPFGLGYKACQKGAYPGHNGARSTVQYKVENGWYVKGLVAGNMKFVEPTAAQNASQSNGGQSNNLPGSNYLQHCNEMVNPLDVEYSLRLQTQWDRFDSGTMTKVALENKKWHPDHTPDSDAGSGFQGGVLYLTDVASKAPFSLDQHSDKDSKYHVGAFDCTEAPVPGEKECSTTVISRYPFRKCWVDTYRSDSLRAEVPVCDINVTTTDAQQHETFKLSHASFFDGMGCKAALAGAAGKAATYTGCSKLATVTVFNSSDQPSIIGTCCDKSTTHKEAFPNQGNGFNTYNCNGQYMFTHAEREAAFGSDRTIGHGYYSNSDGSELAGFNTGDTNITAAHGYWHKDRAYAEDFDNFAKDYTSGSFTNNEALDLTGKNEWSISSDIHGAYKVVASTDILGTKCELRSSASNNVHNYTAPA